jgi:hypothetical protein
MGKLPALHMHYKNSTSSLHIRRGRLPIEGIMVLNCNQDSPQWGRCTVYKNMLKLKNIVKAQLLMGLMSALPSKHRS